MIGDNAKVLQEIIDSMQHPFYVIDVNTYVIKFANKACGFGELKDGMTCHLLTHRFSAPCQGKHICPLREVKRTKQAVKTDHIHFDERGNPRNMEVHGDPVFDEKGNLVMMIEYSFDVTDRIKAQETLKQKLEEVEKFNKVMVSREQRVLELKAEVDKALRNCGMPPKYHHLFIF